MLPLSTLCQPFSRCINILSGNVRNANAQVLILTQGESNGTPLQYSCLENPILFPGKSRPWGREELDTTEQLHILFSLSCIGEGNGNPLQCFCLENPRDGGARWAAVYGVAESDTTEAT